MCENCWVEAGSPTELPEDADRIESLLTALYELEETGGPLHVEVDDYNLDGPVIPVYAQPWYRPEAHGSFTSGTRAICGELAVRLNAIPVAQRYAVVHRHWQPEAFR